MTPHFQLIDSSRYRPCLINLDAPALLPLHRPAHHITAPATLAPQPPLDRAHIAAPAGHDTFARQRDSIDHAGPATPATRDAQI